MNNRINVTKTFLPPIGEYEDYLKKIWQSGQLTNSGPLVSELEAKLRTRLGVDNLHFVTNGTLALQIALRALDIEGSEVITTPFSYVATTSAILWEKCLPVFVDIEEDTFCVDADKIEAAITAKTKAILVVHVYGYPCDVDKIAAIAKKHDLKVIYDAAHAFNAEYMGKQLLSYGDISICSFHATKLFHTIEGGCVIVKDEAVNEKVELMKRFGHTGDEHFMLGINAKASEFQAAMGLVNLEHVDAIISRRKKISEAYDRLLDAKLRRPKPVKGHKYNYGYYPVVFDTENDLLMAQAKLEDNNIFGRRYFYPSLNTLPYVEQRYDCPVSESIARRVLCLPLYDDLNLDDVARVCEVLNEA